MQNKKKDDFNKQIIWNKLDERLSCYFVISSEIILNQREHLIEYTYLLIAFHFLQQMNVTIFLLLKICFA